MARTRRIAITGATGALGGAVARNLGETSTPQRLIVRDPSRAPQVPNAEVAVARGYDDATGMRAALQGCDTLLLVSGRESERRVAEHRLAIDAAVGAGVEHVVYTSFVGAAPDATFTLARDHYATERYVRECGASFTFLRDALYLDLIPALVSPAGEIAGPAGDGAISGVARDDVADCAAAILREPEAHRSRTYELTGPAAFTLAEAAAELGAATGERVTYRNESPDEAYASRAVFDAPAWQLEAWVTTYLAIASGEMSTVTGDVAGLLGRPATSLRAFLARSSVAPGRVES